MTFSTFDIALPIGLGVIFGAYRYVEQLKSNPSNAVQTGLSDGLKGIAGMGILTVVLKYFGML